MSKLMLVLTLILVAGTPAFADTLFDISFSGQVLSGSGTMTVQPYATGIYSITAITGTTTYDSKTSPIKELLFNENLLFYPPASFGFFNPTGLSYLLNDGSSVNLASDQNGGYRESLGSPSAHMGFSDNAPIIVTPSVPEPDSLILLTTGLLGTIGLIRRRIYR